MLTMNLLTPAGEENPCGPQKNLPHTRRQVLESNNADPINEKTQFNNKHFFGKSW